MNRRRVSAAVLLGSAVIALTTACGPEESGAAATGSGPAASAGDSTAEVPAGSATTASDTGSRPASAPAPAAKGTTGGETGSDGKPCYHPEGYDHFLELASAQVDQGDTRVNFTEVSCTYDPADEQNVTYTAVRKGSALIHAGAEVQVVGDTGNPRTVPAGWLVDHKPPNTPYFYYRADAQGRITAMQEIYHP
ncbi:hypothetical protein OHU11_13900 [Streptomyces sp. NBC_00257]|uniref:hypothetical protein n=1 Tax=unclassified Streptomyces TaxID=2593676 RepID=UPI00224ED68D|nr:MULTISPECIES: hypothetical protein [unclassified Streptomyces]WTB57003.1 hypothetical protein OG832_29520 [Streptomyces sp. NBC_00826]WTH90113.1 hypothetical protein OIC43_14175 [Streptomyces sp. NBC_00825]WTH98841.1 hypothetical protein OHA23_14160 [Streptomyces sp. NBC_00822]MCX4864235.1 hypothetical protein [Streptomyces sp. NBC_00906]MCX4895473.1 hypothetical protein [Streptomyces sp. NBC_00892]